MNNVFNIQRFGNYFLYDLRRAKNNYGLSLLLLGLMPVIIFLFFQFFSLISGNGLTELPDEMQFMAVFIATIVVILGAGVKLYGFVTEKRAGSDFLLLPASTLEKWLSILLMVCIVVPVILFSLTFLSDTLMSLVFPNTYGDRMMVADLARNMFDILGEEGISINLPGLLFLNWCANILTFTLGAVCFKKAKVAKTLLCVFAFSMVLSLILVLSFGTSHIDTDWLEMHFSDPQSIERFLNWTISIVLTVLFGGLLGGLYYRLRTLKH